jgi:hypothetical protein
MLKMEAACSSKVRIYLQVYTKLHPSTMMKMEAACSSNVHIYLQVYTKLQPSTRLKMEAVCSSKTFVFICKSTRHYNSEDKHRSIFIVQDDLIVRRSVYDPHIANCGSPLDFSYFFGSRITDISLERSFSLSPYVVLLCTFCSFDMQVHHVCLVLLTEA